MNNKTVAMVFVFLWFLSCAVFAATNMIKVQFSIEGERRQWEVSDNGYYYGIESLPGGDPKPITKQFYISPADAGHKYTMRWVWGEWVTPPPYFPESTWYKFSVEVLEKPDDVYFIPSDNNSPMEGTLLFRTNQYGLTNIPPDTSQIEWNFTISTPSIGVVDGDKKSDAGDPINLESGGNHFDQNDLSINCPFKSLIFKRSYNNKLPEVGSGLGKGWNHSLNSRLTTSYESVYRGRTSQVWKVLSEGDDRLTYFPAIGDSWGSPYDSDLMLSNVVNGFELYGPGDQLRYFGTNGLITSISNKYYVIEYTYTNSSLGSILTNVRHRNGQYFDLSYSNNLLVAVSSPVSNYNVRFQYNEASNMISATRRTRNGDDTEIYRYSDGYGSLTQRVSRAGSVVNYRYVYNTNYIGGLTSRAIESSIGERKYHHVTVEYGSLNPSNKATFHNENTTSYFENVIDVMSGQSVLRKKGFDEEELFYDMSNNIVLTKMKSQDDKVFYISNQYDSAHRVISQVSGLGSLTSNKWELGWDEQLDVISLIKGPNGMKSEIIFTNGLPISKQIYDEDKVYETKYSYWGNGLIKAITNANGYSVQYSYNEFGYLNKIMPEGGPWISISNNQLGQVTSLSYEDGRTVEYDISEAGLINSIRWPDQIHEYYLYDSDGNVTSYIDRAERRISYKYLPTGDLEEKRIEHNGTSVVYRIDYDKQLNIVSVKDELNRDVECYLLNKSFQPITVTNIEGQSMSIDWTVGNRIRSTQRYDGSIVSNDYDEAGRLDKTVYPGSTNVYVYLPNNLILLAANEEGLISNKYSKANRLINTTSVAPRSQVSFAYHPAGQIASVSNGDIFISNTLDSGDRVKSIQKDEVEIAYNYSPSNGLLLQMIVSNINLVASYEYDLLSRVTSIVWASSGACVKKFIYDYNDYGLVGSINREDGSYSLLFYDILNRLIGEAQYSSTGELLLQNQFAYDLAGNRINKIQDGLICNYIKGQGNRLSSWSVTNAPMDLRIDLSGYANEYIGSGSQYGKLWVSNQISVVPDIAGSNFYVYGLNIELGTQKIYTAICDLAGNTTYTTNSLFISIITNGQYRYDLAGNITNVVYVGKQYKHDLSLRWNGKYQLIEARTNGILAESHGYDAYGRRAWTSDGTSTNYFIYANNHVIAEVDELGNVLKSYVSGPGVDNWISMTVHTGTTAKTYYCITDHLGTVHALTDETGNVFESYSYDAWGRVLGVYNAIGEEIPLSQVGNTYLWQGREYSWKTKLYYFRARWYDPITGRWLSHDPIGISGGLNQYVFCGNNPVNWRDPFGLCKIVPYLNPDFKPVTNFYRPMNNKYGDPYHYTDAHTEKGYGPGFPISGNAFAPPINSGWFGAGHPGYSNLQYNCQPVEWTVIYDTNKPFPSILRGERHQGWQYENY